MWPFGWSGGLRDGKEGLEAGPVGIRVWQKATPSQCRPCYKPVVSGWETPYIRAAALGDCQLGRRSADTHTRPGSEVGKLFQPFRLIFASAFGIKDAFSLLFAIPGP
ncbi:hypothetical protein MHYP_G00346200 [Metynnis hypsauchen]